MTDEMRVLPFASLLNWVLEELELNQSIFGIPRSLFYVPDKAPPYSTTMFGHHLTTPIGPGAGPHTQLSQNIICAWLSGGRFIELKTVQIMDELEIPRPCIDMEDEGYNVEWSQELKLEQSASEYVNAWALVHILRRLLEFEDRPFGTIFNMSVGYNLEGIQQPRMLQFMDTMADASEQIDQIKAVLEKDYPQFADIEIPAQLTDNVTLSTMHGCPPDEMESICRYLIEEKGLHTTIKLNPTLLGKGEVMRILHDDLGFVQIDIPDAVFEHDLQYSRAVELIETLQQAAAEKGVAFGIKLSNTLAMANRKGDLPGDEMYMSGRALYPITVNLFHRLAQEFNGELNVSYSAGADAINAPRLLAAGARPVTVVSDLLKPGGYSRMLQYLDNLTAEMQIQGAADLDQFARNRLDNLKREAAAALQDQRYKKSYHPHGLPKTDSALQMFDCITAPCAAQCAVAQDVSEYAWLIAQGEYDRALEVILARNPLPGVTGYVCTHLCQTRCTRNNYDEPVAIRALKRFAAEHGRSRLDSSTKTGHRVAVIGSGPSGLSAAYFLALNGVDVTIYEARQNPGGMLSIAPTFRLPEEVVGEDIDRIRALGVKIELGHFITVPPEQLLQQGFDAVYVASGTQRGVRLGIPGEDGDGVHQALDLLEAVRLGETPDLGTKVLVIGGGNSAMDAARTALRLAGPVTVVYRRTRQEMPATDEELEGLFVEGGQLQELASPREIVLHDGKVTALRCVRNELGPPDSDGRRKPLAIEGSEFEIEADTVVIAIGQQPDIAFLKGSQVNLNKNGTIAVDEASGLAGPTQVYAGGDAVRGPDIIIAACADGRRAAESICTQLGVTFARPSVWLPEPTVDQIATAKQARVIKGTQQKPNLLAPKERTGHALVEMTLSEEKARIEAARCLQCAAICDKCVEVCPNRSNYAVETQPLAITLPLIAYLDGQATVVAEEPFQLRQGRQIIHVDDFCNECGNCATFCVHQGRPYADKPRLVLTEEGLATSEDAFYVAHEDGRWVVRRRKDGLESQITLGAEGDILWQDEMLQLTLDVNTGQLEILASKPFQGQHSLSSLAEMYVLARGVIGSLAFILPT